MTSQFPQYNEYTAGQNQRPSGFGHPSLGMPVTTEQRDRAERFLAEAYADGRLNEFEFDSRMEQVLSATNRKDLNAAFYGLVEVPPTSQALGLHPAYRPNLVSQQAGDRSGKTIAGVAHFSALFTWWVGPLIAFLASRDGTYAKRESAKALNFQIISTLAFIAGGILTGINDGATGWLMGLMWVGWFVLTLIGGVKASQGEDWKNPVQSVVKWKPVKVDRENHR